MQSGNPAVYLLKEHLERLATSAKRVDDCEWVAACLYQLEEYGDAGGWYELAGGLRYSGSVAPAAVRALSAIGDYEKALECYKLNGDEDAFQELSGMLRELKRACASA
jgi:tetratricopeptide (TPR) repeat protein